MAMPRLPRPPIYDEILENCLCEVRVALNKTSILGGQRFKVKIDNTKESITLTPLIQYFLRGISISY